jgi:hypothetical protein
MATTSLSVVKNSSDDDADCMSEREARQLLLSSYTLSRADSQQDDHLNELTICFHKLNHTYRKLCLQYHPDKLALSSSPAPSSSSFVNLQLAYKKLRDEVLQEIQRSRPNPMRRSMGMFSRRSSSGFKMKNCVIACE